MVVEKPFTITSKEAAHLIATQKETGQILTVFQNRRYDSDFRTLRQVLDSGKLGEITEFQNHYDVDNPVWVQKWTSPDLEPGEGMLYGLGTHNLDQTLLLYGKPKSVTAFTRALRRESKTDDSFTVVLQYGGEKKNLICTVKTTIVSTLPMEKQLKFLVRGRDGTFIKVSSISPSFSTTRQKEILTYRTTQHGEDPQIDHLFAPIPVTSPDFGVEPSSYHGEIFTKEQFDKCQTQAGSAVAPSQQGVEVSGLWSGVYPSAKGSYADFYVDVANAILGKGELKVKPEESAMNIRCIELARESAETGRTVEWSD